MPCEGLVPVDQFLSFYESIEVASQITNALPDAMDESLGTMPFQPVLKIMVEFPGKFMYAWLSPDVNPDELVRQFDGQTRLDEATEGASGISFILTYAKSPQDVADTDSTITTCLQQEVIMFMPIDSKEQLRVQLDHAALEHVQFDQFGRISVGQKVCDDTMLFDFRPMRTSLGQNLCFALAAFRNVQRTYMQDVS